MTIQKSGQRTVVHIFSGDLWAGAEVMIFNLLGRLREDPAVRLIALSLNEGVLTRRLRQAGVETQVIAEGAHGFPLIFLKAACLLRGRGVDVIHTHRYKENLLGLLLAKVLGVRRLITTVHGLDEPPEAAGQGKESQGAGLRCRRMAVNRHILRKYFTDVVAVSEDIASALVRRHGFPPANVTVIRNGIPLPPAEGRHGDAPGRAGNGLLHIGTVGRMAPVKDFDLFLDVAAEVRRRAGRVRFSILGEGPLRSRLRGKAEALGIGDAIEFLSPVENPLPYYRSLDLYLNTSRHEGIPLAILEAMACGLPVVAPAVGGIPEIMDHGEGRALLRSRERGAFVDACIRFLDDGELRRRTGEINRRTIAEKFEVRGMSQGYAALYAT